MLRMRAAAQMEIRGNGETAHCTLMRGLRGLRGDRLQPGIGGRGSSRRGNPPRRAGGLSGARLPPRQQRPSAASARRRLAGAGDGPGDKPRRYRARRLQALETLRDRTPICRFPGPPGFSPCALGAPISLVGAPHLYQLLRRTMTDAGQSTRAAKDRQLRRLPAVHGQQGGDLHSRSRGAIGGRRLPTLQAMQRSVGPWL